MKIRGSLVLIFISAAALLPLRINLLGGTIAADSSWGTVFKIGVIAAAVLMLGVSMLSFNTSSYVRIRKNIPCSIASAIMAGFVGYDSVITMLGGYPDVLTGKSAVAYGVFGIAAAIMIFAFAVGFALGSPSVSRVPILTLFPAIWAGLRLTFMFMRYTTIADISEHYFDVCYYVCLVVFFLCQAKVFSSVETRKSIRSAVGFGGCAALFVLLSAVARLWVMKVNQTGNFTGLSAPKGVDIFAVVYIICYLFFITAGKHHAYSHGTLPSEDMAITDSPVMSRNQALDAVTGGNKNVWDDTPELKPDMTAIKNSASTIGGGVHQSNFKLTPTPYAFSNDGQLQPIYVISQEALAALTGTDAYYDDDDTVGTAHGKRPTNAKGSLAPRDNKVYVIKNDKPESDPGAGMPRAHISGEQPARNETSEPAPPTEQISAEIEEIIDNHINISPDEAPAETDKHNISSSHPRLGRGYLPKSSVERMDDGFRFHNMSDE